MTTKVTITCQENSHWDLSVQAQDKIHLDPDVHPDGVTGSWSSNYQPIVLGPGESTKELYVHDSRRYIVEEKVREVKKTEYKKYRRSQIAELARWTPGFDMTDVSVSVEDMKRGSPTVGDMIARNPKNHADRWLVAAQYFADNFEEA